MISELTVIQVLIIWGAAGAAAACIGEPPKTRTEALVMLSVYGPLCWITVVIMVVVGLVGILARRRRP